MYTCIGTCVMRPCVCAYVTDTDHLWSVKALFSIRGLLTRALCSNKEFVKLFSVTLVFLRFVKQYFVLLYQLRS